MKGQNCSGKKGGGLFLLGGWQGSPESRSSSVRKRTVGDGTRFMILSRLSLVSICSVISARGLWVVTRAKRQQMQRVENEVPSGGG